MRQREDNKVGSCTAWLDTLDREQDLPDEDLRALLTALDTDPQGEERLRTLACQKRQAVFGNRIYIRGLVEISNICKNDCLYCGIRRSNSHCQRYRLSSQEILACARTGYGLGFRTFVLQGGEDPYYTDDILCRLLEDLKRAYPDCAITLSLGERSRGSYRRLREAGADRYLLRHETATKAHYQMLHPKEMDWDNRMRCLEDLQALGYQVGCGFMVGSPGQTIDDLVRDLRFIKNFGPQMCGIGPFIPHHDTPFRGEPAGSLTMTLRLLSIIRLMLPEILLPATTALGTIAPGGRERGVLAGANVVMPNLSPEAARTNYTLYDNKLSTGAESAGGLAALAESMADIGCTLAVDRGDAPGWNARK